MCFFLQKIGKSKTTNYVGHLHALVAFFDVGSIVGNPGQPTGFTGRCFSTNFENSFFSKFPHFRFFSRNCVACRQRPWVLWASILAEFALSNCENGPLQPPHRVESREVFGERNYGGVHEMPRPDRIQHRPLRQIPLPRGPGLGLWYRVSN